MLTAWPEVGYILHTKAAWKALRCVYNIVITTIFPEISPFELTPPVKWLGNIFYINLAVEQGQAMIDDHFESLWWPSHFREWGVWFPQKGAVDFLCVRLLGMGWRCAPDAQDGLALSSLVYFWQVCVGNKKKKYVFTGPKIKIVFCFGAFFFFVASSIFSSFKMCFDLVLKKKNIGHQCQRWKSWTRTTDSATWPISNDHIFDAALRKWRWQSSCGCTYFCEC